MRRFGAEFFATIEDFSFTFQTSIRLQMLGSYLGPELVTEGRGAIFLGPTGLWQDDACCPVRHCLMLNTR